MKRTIETGMAEPSGSLQERSAGFMNSATMDALSGLCNLLSKAGPEAIQDMSVHYEKKFQECSTEADRLRLSGKYASEEKPYDFVVKGRTLAYRLIADDVRKRSVFKSLGDEVRDPLVSQLITLLHSDPIVGMDEILRGIPGAVASQDREVSAQQALPQTDYFFNVGAQMAYGEIILALAEVAGPASELQGMGRR